MNPNGLNVVLLALALATFHTALDYVWITIFHVLTKLPNALYFLLCTGFLLLIYLRCVNYLYLL